MGKGTAVPDGDVYEKDRDKANRAVENNRPVVGALDVSQYEPGQAGREHGPNDSESAYGIQDCVPGGRPIIQRRTFMVSPHLPLDRVWP